MRKLLASMTLAIMLAGCQTTANVVDIIAQVQASTRLACSFLPTATTVAQIIATLTGGAPVVSVISTATDAICRAVATAPVPLAASRSLAAQGFGIAALPASNVDRSFGMVNGVRVVGRVVR